MQVNKKYEKINALVIGCGSIGKRHIGVLLELGLTHITAADPSDSQLDGIRELFPSVKTVKDYKEALKNDRFDVAFVFTPTGMHLSVMKEVLNAGCHVFVEKPLANSTNGVDEIKELAHSKGLLVMVGFCFRYHEVLKRAKVLLESGTIGRLINVRALMGEPFAEIQPNYLNMYYSKYSGAFELVHDLDLALWYSGQEVEEVYSVYGPFSDMGMESPDSVELLLRFKDRGAANVHLDFYQHPRRRQIDLMGVKGTITVEFASWDEATLSYYNTDIRRWDRTTYKTARNDMFRDEDAEFLNAVLGEGEISCTIDEAMRSLSVIEKVYSYDSENKR